LSAPLVTIDAAGVMAALPMGAAIDALERAFAAQRPTGTPQRLHLRGLLGSVADAENSEHDEAELLVMPAMVEGWAGTKMVSLVASNPARGLPRVTGTYTLFGPPGLQPLAQLDGAALTELRTAAVSGLATRHLAREGSQRVVVVGSGVQARAHVRAMVEVLEARGERAAIVVVARSESGFTQLVTHVREHGIAAPIVRGAIEEVSEADVVCLCTSSAVSLVSAGMLPAGVHVNAVGAYRPDMRELDAGAVAICEVSVELRAAAMAEKGDLLQAESEGRWSRDAIRADLHELASGAVRGRLDATERTLFASVGHASEDLIVARAVFEAVQQH
jgi:ornithine cyclodeaminase/alanine dehydrogenase-like protein (mu-crystallin family)